MEKDDKFEVNMGNSEKLGNQMKEHHRGQGTMEIWNKHMGDYKRQGHANREEDWMQDGRETFKEEENAGSSKGCGWD